MELQKNNLFKKIFAIAFFFATIGALLRINHIENSSILLIIAVLSTFIYVAVGIYEVNKSNRIGSSEKVFWTIGFILLSFFTGLYNFMNRERIITKYK